MKFCRLCKQTIGKRASIYCSNKCQADFQYIKYVNDWKNNLVSGERGINTKTMSKHISRYLIEKYGNACTLCGWSEVSLFSGRVPLEMDHIDGNSENNTEDNLRLICPNCHSLTQSFRNLNKGSGRSWRRDKYMKSA